LVVMTVANAPISLKARWRSHVPNYPFVSFPQPESAAARRLALGGYSAFLAHPKQILGYHQVDSTSATRRPAVLPACDTVILGCSDSSFRQSIMPLAAACLAWLRPAPRFLPLATLHTFN
jgi:hypothetical protein